MRKIRKIQQRKENRRKCKRILFGILFFLVVGNWFMKNKSVSILTKEVIIHPLNEPLIQDVSVYLKNVAHPTQANVDFSNVNIAKEGFYKGYITYQNKTYEIVFQVCDLATIHMLIQQENKVQSQIQIDKKNLDGGVFLSEQEANDWVDDHILDQTSKWYGAIGHIHKLQNNQWYAYLQY